MDAFSGWELDLPKPIDEIEVCSIFARVLRRREILHLQNITCVQNIYCDYGGLEDPIPAANDSVKFSLYLDFLGQPKRISGPMNLGESISIDCLEEGFKVFYKIR